jgi:predicted nucleic acid-binding protein
VELSRTLDNFGITTRLPAELRAQFREIGDRNLAHLDLIPLNVAVLRRAGSGFPTPLGTLDAIHLATALLWVENAATPLTLLTHDRQLATAARACGLPVYPV